MPRMTRISLDRRTLLLGIASTAAFRAGPATTATPGSESGASAERLATLARYCGLYRLSANHSVGIDRFTTDGGEALLLLADHLTGVVRSLRADDSGGFSLRRGFDPASPSVGTARFDKDDRGRILAVRLQQREGEREQTARNTASRDIDITFNQGDARLAGTLIVPEGPGPHPSIVLLHGSGPLTRYSFGPYPRFFSGLGLAVLMYDKRGTGDSTGLRLDASTGRPEITPPGFYPEALAADATAAFRFLQSRPEIDAGQIGLWGSSEGGMLSTYVASRVKDVAFAINSSGFVGPLWKTLSFQVEAKLKAGGAPAQDITDALAFNQQWMDVARTGTGYDAFVRDRKTALRRFPPWTFYENAGFASLEQMRWAWKHILSFDPSPALRAVRCPVLGIFGERDVSTDSMAASRAMLRLLAEGGSTDVATRVIANAGHSLMEMSEERRMAPGVFATLRGWISARIATAGS
jgi:pimeloyl-ACP methyl ester carboxylesterase